MLKTKVSSQGPLKQKKYFKLRSQVPPTKSRVLGSCLGQRMNRVVIQPMPRDPGQRRNRVVIQPPPRDTGRHHNNHHHHWCQRCDLTKLVKAALDRTSRVVYACQLSGVPLQNSFHAVYKMLHGVYQMLLLPFHPLYP